MHVGVQRQPRAWQSQTVQCGLPGVKVADHTACAMSKVAALDRLNHPPAVGPRLKQTSLPAETLGIACAVAALPASAQFQKPADAIEHRKAAFTVMASHFGRLTAMTNGRIPSDAKWPLKTPTSR